METRGGRVHHAYGRCAPYIRNSRTIHAVPMHHHPRFCCSLGAAYADPYRYLLWVLSTAPELAQQDSAWAEKVTPSLAPDTCKIPE